MKYAVIRFPGSNCDWDMFYVLRDQLHVEPIFVDYRETELPEDVAAVLVPGGFSYGDYLRSGAIARFAPIMTDVKRFAGEGKPVLGICNGFQILTEARLLPGGLRKNQHLEFVCQQQELFVQNNQTAFSNQFEQGEKVMMPVAHGDGNYYCDEATLQQLKDNHQIVLTYSENPNGSIDDIAGIVNEQGNVMGMMPHPERASEDILAGTDGLRLFQSFVENQQLQK